MKALKTKETELKDVNTKIERLEYKMISDEIEPKTYKVWFSKLNAQKAVLENEIIALKKSKKTVFDSFDEAIPLLMNMKNLYHEVSLEGKHLLLKTWFELGISYDGKILRTATIHPALVDNYLRIKHFGLLEVEQPEEKMVELYSCTA